MPKISTWCFLRDSERIKAVILYQIRRKSLMIKDLSELSGVEASKISKWINGSYPRAITQSQLIAIAKALGISLDVKIEISD